MMSFSHSMLWIPHCVILYVWSCTEIRCLTVMPDFLVPVTCVFYFDLQVLLISRFRGLFNHLNLISNLHKWLLYLYIYMFGKHVYICLFMCAWNTRVYMHVENWVLCVYHPQSFFPLCYWDRVYLWTYNLSFWLLSCLLYWFLPCAPTRDSCCISLSLHEELKFLSLAIVEPSSKLFPDISKFLFLMPCDIIYEMISRQIIEKESKAQFL